MGLAVPLILSILAQSSGSDPLYVESWRTGSEAVEEADFEFALACCGVGQASETRVLKGAKGTTFQLVIQEEAGLGWMVQLFETGSAGKDLLRPSLDPYQDYFTARDYPGLFLFGTENPGPDWQVAGIFQERIIKVKGFFVSLKVGTASFNSTALSLNLQVRFTNTCVECPEETGRT